MHNIIYEKMFGIDYIKMVVGYYKLDDEESKKKKKKTLMMMMINKISMHGNPLGQIARA